MFGGDGQTVDGDAHVKLVTGFRDPTDAWRSQARIRENEEGAWGLFVTRHAPRAARNRHRIDMARNTALFTRSVNAWGSNEAAHVAAMRVAGPPNILERLGLGGPATPPTNGAPDPTAGKGAKR